MTGRRHAVLVAVGRYLDPEIPDLAAPALDVARLRHLLADDRIGRFDQVEVLTDPTSYEWRLHVDSVLSQADPDDTLLLHFAGHAYPDDDGTLYLAGTETRCSLLMSTSVGARDLATMVRRSPARHIMLILDCCHSAAFLRDYRARGSVSAWAEVAEELPVSRVGKTILTSSDSHALSYEHRTSSLFVDAFVEGVSTGAADLDGDGKISVADLYTYLYRELDRRAVGRRVQRPQLFRDGGDMFVATVPAERRRSSGSPAPEPLGLPAQAAPGALGAPSGEPRPLLRELLGTMETSRKSRLRPGYRVNDVLEWVTAVEDPRLRTGPYWPDAPTTPRFGRQRGGWDPEAVDAFTATHTPYAASPMVGDGTTPFAADLRALLATEPDFRLPDQLSASRLALLRSQLRLPDREQLIGGIVDGGGAFTEYLYFTDWGLRGRNDRGETTMYLRVHNDKAQLLAIPYADFPRARFEPGEFYNSVHGEGAIGCMWYQLDVLYGGEFFPVFASSDGEGRAARLADWLNRVKNLCAGAAADAHRHATDRGW